MSTDLLLKIIQIPTRFLGVMILTLSFVGAYSLRNGSAAGFGVFGMILKHLNRSGNYLAPSWIKRACALQANRNLRGCMSVNARE